MAGKRRVLPLPLVPPSGDAETISVGVHSTPRSRDPPSVSGRASPPPGGSAFGQDAGQAISASPEPGPWLTK